MPEDTIKPGGNTIKVNAPPKRGPGRPAGTTTAAKGKKEDVAQAMASLESMYNMVGLGVMAFGLPKTTEAWMEASENLKATNEDALNASPKLAAWLANAGQAGGTSAFMLAHVMAIGNVAMVARAEIASRAAKAVRESDGPNGVEADPLIPDGSVTRDPTLIPGL